MDTEMTLVHPCVRPSVRHSICPSFRPSFCPSDLVPANRTDLKFYRLPSHHNKICMLFLIFVLTIFDEVMALC